MDVLAVVTGVGHTLITDVLPFILNNAADLIGFALPLLVEVINRDVVKERERFFVTICVCIAAAIILKWHSLLIGSVGDVITSMVIIFSESQMVFKLYFKNSYWRKVIQKSDDPKPTEIVPPERMNQIT